MRILIISKSFLPRNSARALQISKVAEAIADAGADVRVVAGIEDGDERTRKPGINYIPYKENTHSGKTSKLLTKARNALHQRHWIKNCIRETNRLIKDFRPDIIMSISSPIESHQVALSLDKKSDVKWVAYFSDPCPPCISPIPYRYSRNALIDAYDRSRARLILSQADAIIVPSPYMVGMFETELGVKIASKSVAIPHIGTISNLKPMTIEHEYSGWLIHVGGIARQRCSSALLDGINILKKDHKWHFPGLLCIGSVCAEFKEMVHIAGLEDCIKFIGYIDNKVTTEYAYNAGCLLLIEAEMPRSVFLPSKFADYVMTGKPILAITPQVSQVRNYIKHYKTGLAVSNNVSEIVAGLRRLLGTYHKDESCTLSSCSELQEEFADSFIAKRYIKLFDKVL